jgi:hypothetical protein
LGAWLAPLYAKPTYEYQVTKNRLEPIYISNKEYIPSGRYGNDKVLWTAVHHPLEMFSKRNYLSLAVASPKKEMVLIIESKTSPSS